MNRILAIEDEKDIREYLTQVLKDVGYEVEVGKTGEEGLEKIKNTSYDLVLLDIGLPGIDGYEVCKKIRKDYPDLPIIVLTAHDSPPEEVTGLNLGADDFIGKPFVVDELLARIKAAIRRKADDTTKLTVGDLVLDTQTFEVHRGNDPISLTSKEFKLLKYLMINKERILTREMILNSVWMYSYDLQTRVIDVYMGYLRKKIDGGRKKKLIHSVRGFGYIIHE